MLFGNDFCVFYCFAVLHFLCVQKCLIVKNVIVVFCKKVDMWFCTAEYCLTVVLQFCYMRVSCVNSAVVLHIVREQCMSFFAIFSGLVVFID